MNTSIRNLLFALVLASANSRAGIILQLDPSDGVVGGFPGDTVGWGFTFTTDDAHSYFVTDVEFCIGANIPNTGTCNHTPLGDFTPLAAMNGLVIGPAFNPSGYSEFFDPFFFTGLGSFLINPLAAQQDVTGNIHVYFDEYDGNPFLGANQLPSGVVSQEALVSIFQGGVPTAPSVPEPTTFLLVAAGFAAMRIWRRPA